MALFLRLVGTGAAAASAAAFTVLSATTATTTGFLLFVAAGDSDEPSSNWAPWVPISPLSSHTYSEDALAEGPLGLHTTQKVLLTPLFPAAAAAQQQPPPSPLPSQSDSNSSISDVDIDFINRNSPPSSSEQEDDDVVTSEDMETRQRWRLTQPVVPTIPAGVLAQKHLSAEEYLDAENEFMSGLENLQITTTTTRPPGFFKEVGSGIKNFFLAPFRATRQVIEDPKSVVSSNIGSASLSAQKFGSAVGSLVTGNGMGQRWADVVRDTWRTLTINPQRLKEAEMLSRKAALHDKSAAKRLMYDDGGVATAYGKSLSESRVEREKLGSLADAAESEVVKEQLFQRFLSKK